MRNYVLRTNAPLKIEITCDFSYRIRENETDSAKRAMRAATRPWVQLFQISLKNDPETRGHLTITPKEPQTNLRHNQIR